MGYLSENFLNVYKKRQKKYYAHQTIAAGTTLADETAITLPLTYIVGNNSLELFFNGKKLIKYDGENDGHYSEYGTAGDESTTIKIHRAVSDGSFVLPEDAILETYVKGVEQE